MSFGLGMMHGRMISEAADNSEGEMMAGGGAGMLRRSLMERRAKVEHNKSDSAGDAAYERSLKACMESKATQPKRRFSGASTRARAGQNSLGAPPSISLRLRMDTYGGIVDPN